MTIYTLTDQYDDQQVAVCDAHAKEMPAVNGDTVTIDVMYADKDIPCEFCPKD